MLRRRNAVPCTARLVRDRVVRASRGQGTDGPRPEDRASPACGPAGREARAQRVIHRNRSRSSPTSAAARGQTRRASSAGSVLVAGGRRFPPWSWRARAMQRRRACGRGPRTATPLTPHEDVERPAEPSTLRRSESPVPGSRTARTARHGATMSLGRDTIVAPRRVSQGGRHGGTRGRDGGGELEQTGELEAT